jgi:two-component system, sensor histidine kinase PdtaS
LEGDGKSIEALFGALEIDPDATVPLARIVRQRAAFAELYAASLRESSLDRLLTEACRVAAKGGDAPMSKIMEHRPDAGELVLIAAWGLRPDALGSVATDDPSNPPGECIATGRPVLVADVRRRGDYHLPPIFPEYGVIASINLPVVGQNGIFGVLEVDAREPRVFDAIDISYLASVAGIVAEAVERVRREGALRAAHDAHAVLLREQQHRVRNNLMTIQALLHRGAREISSDDARRRFLDIERRVFAMAALFDHLLGIELSDRIVVAGYLESLCRHVGTLESLQERGIELAFVNRDGGVELPLDLCTAAGTVVNELVANAVEHAFPGGGGRIEVRLDEAEDGIEIAVADNGAGFAEPETPSVGLSLARRLVRQVGGRLALASDAAGTTWTISLPTIG